jgi:hypothetical protein
MHIQLTKYSVFLNSELIMPNGFLPITMNPVRNKTVISNWVNYEHLTISYRLTQNVPHPQNLFPEIRATSDERRATVNMQNKPNLLNAQINVTSVKTTNYEQITMNNVNKNKPNQTQFHPVRHSQDKKIRISNGARRQKCLTG